MLRVCLLSFALACAVLAETTVDPGDDFTGTLTTATPPITEYSLSVKHLKSTTNSIVFKWETAVPDWMKIQGFSISAAIQSSESDAVMTYPPLPSYESNFEADDLVKDAIWDVCITSTVRNGTAADAQNVEFKECFESFTIPYIRPDSVYGLLIVIGVIVALILAGIIQWKCAVMKKEKEDAAAAAAEEENEGKNKYANTPEEKKPILLSSPSDDRPKSSIEDEDIPYITPPWSEIEREEKEKKAAANSFSKV